MSHHYSPDLPLDRVFSARVTLYCLAGAVAMILGWTALATVEVTVETKGILRPEGEAHRVVLEIPGTVRRFNVTENSTVRQGDVLVELDAAEVTAERERIVERIHLSEERTKATNSALESYVRSSLIERAQLERDLESLQRERTKAAEDLSRNRERQRHAEELAAHERRRSEESVRRSSEMLMLGLTSQASREETLFASERARLEERMIQLAPDGEAALAMKDDAIEKTVRGLELAHSRYLERVRQMESELLAGRSQTLLLYEELSRIEARVAKHTVVSPESGVVTALARLHENEVVSAGAEIARITSPQSRQIVEAWLRPDQIVSIRAGQQVLLEKASTAGRRLRPLEATLTTISQDLVRSDALAGPAFRLSIQPLDRRPGQLGESFYVRIVIGRERILALLFNRIRKEFSL